MKGYEFYNFNDEVWYRKDNICEKLSEHHTDIIDKIINVLNDFYPDAYKALEKEYKNIIDRRLKNYRIVYRFCKCNFGEIDNIMDFDLYGKIHFERVVCPLRGECRLENICCQPKFNSKISDAEMRVLNLLYKGETKENIAEKLYLSLHTIKNHINNAYSRLGIHSTSEFMQYAREHNLFKEEEL